MMEEVIEELEDEKISYCELKDSLKNKVKDLEISVERKEIISSEEFER